MRSPIISTTANAISSGGTISGDVTISGDLTVTGSGGAVYDEIIEGSLHIKTGSAGTISTLAYADDLVIEQTGEGVGLSLRFDDDRSGSIVWQSTTADNIARIYAAYSSGNEVLAFETVGTERMVIDDDGNVGIGTTSPHSPLTIETALDAADDADQDKFALMIRNAADDNNEELGIGFRISANQAATNAPGGAITFERTTSNSVGSLHFKTAPSSETLPTRMTIDSSGNVGIGIVSPEGLLHLTKTAATSYSYHDVYSTTDGHVPRVVLRKSANATIGYKSETSDGEAIGGLLFHGVNNASAFKNGAGIEVYQDGSASNFVPTYMSFYTSTSSGTVTNLKIDQNSRISLSNNDNGGTGGSDSTSGVTLLGYGAGNNISSGGVDNSFFGHGTGNRNTTGEKNSYFGNLAGFGNATGDHNTYVGYGSGWGVANNNNSNNTGVGFESLKAITTGGSNVAVGYEAGDLLTTGSNNTVIGDSAEVSANSASNQTVVGQGATGQADNSVTLGNADVTAVYMASDSGALVHTAGIQFPATQAANAGANVLDDYEEGTWTPRITDGTNTAVAGGNNEGSYTKIGRVVHLTAYIVVTDLTDSGTSADVGSNARISGLPFTVGNDHQYYSSGVISYGQGLAITAGHSVGCYAMTNATTAMLQVYDNAGGTTNMSGSEFSDDGEIMLQLTYVV